MKPFAKLGSVSYVQIGLQDVLRTFAAICRQKVGPACLDYLTWPYQQSCSLTDTGINYIVTARSCAVRWPDYPENVSERRYETYNAQG